MSDPDEPWVLYCDESGNTGSDWMNQEQPFHVAAGWLVRPTAHGRFVEAIRAAITPRKGQEEPKASTLLRRPSGQRRIAELFERLGREGGALPLYMVAERRFCVAGKAVEVFLDPLTNPSASWLPNTAVGARQEVWETVSALSDDHLVRFVNAYASPSVGGLSTALDALVAGLEALGEHRLAGTFAAARPHLAAICEEETHGNPIAGHGVWTALNLPIMMHVVKMADRILDQGPSGGLAVIHDRIRTFEDLFQFVAPRFVVPDGAPVSFVGDDGRTVRTGLRHLLRFEVRDSVSEPGLRAADLLASTVARLVRAVACRDALPAEMHRLGMLTLPALFDEHALFGGMIGHSRTIAGTLLPLMRDRFPHSAAQGPR